MASSSTDERRDTTIIEVRDAYASMGAKPTDCHKCGMTFPSKNQCYIHRGGHCTGRKYKRPMHKCPKCDLRFATKMELFGSHYGRHELWHPRFLCSVCGANPPLPTRGAPLIEEEIRTCCSNCREAQITRQSHVLSGPVQKVREITDGIGARISHN